MIQRSLLVLSGVGQAGDSADGSVVTSAEDDTCTFTVGAGGTEEGNVGRLIDVLGLLFGDTKKLLGFTSQGSVVDLHLVGFEEDSISGDLEAALNLDDVTRDELFSLKIYPFSVTLDSSLRRDHILEFFHERISFRRLGV